MIIPMFAYSEDNTIEATIGDYKYSLNIDTKEATVIRNPELSTETYTISLPETVVYKEEKYKVTTIGKKAFSGYQKLRWLDLPSSIEKIEDQAFYYCSNLISWCINFSKNLKEIGQEAFWGCDNFATLNFHGPKIFHNKSFPSCIKTIRIDNIEDWCNSQFKCDDYYDERYSNPLSYGRCNLEVFSGYKDYGEDIVSIYNLITNLTIPQTITKINDRAFYRYRRLKKIIIPNTITSLGTKCFANCDSLISVIIPNSVKDIEDDAFYGCLKLPSCTVICSTTQTTANLKMLDANRKASFDRIYTNFNVNYFSKYEGSECKITNLRPNCTCWSYVCDKGYGIKNEELYRATQWEGDAQTKGLDLKITPSITPTVVITNGSYTLDDAVADDSYFEMTINKKNIRLNGNSAIFTNLEPNTKYSIRYFVLNKGYLVEQTSTEITTPTVTFKTLVPQATTNNKALVSAETNLSDYETGAGFEWRKTDAPDVVVSKFGSGIIYNGMLEGRINNLSTSSYYKVRPFYKASDGTMYYGEWIGFDPSDFSYFEPTVHTYARVSVQSTSAKVKGVALQGTDDITEQGFEYWAENAIASRAAGDKQIIQATGQSMEAEITDLAPNTTYNYRAYAKTSKGTTYGETLKFTTPVTTAIIGITNTTNSNLQFNVRNTNNVQIAINGTDKECNYRMNSITGANIASGKTTADGEWHTIANYQLPSGIYIITVSDGKDKKSTKIAIK